MYRTSMFPHPYNKLGASSHTYSIHDIINDLIDELGLTRGNFVCQISKGLDDSNYSNFILSTLEYYDAIVLEELINYMKLYRQSLFNTILKKRRIAYLENECSVKPQLRNNFTNTTTAKYEQNKQYEKLFDCGNHLFIDDSYDDNTSYGLTRRQYIELKRDLDGTANLASGMEVVSRAMQKVKRVIQKKIYLNQQKNIKSSLQWCGGFLFCLTVIIILAYLLACYGIVI